MKTAHLIITHTDPKQTERMISKMTHPDFDFYIHVDRKIDIKPYLFLEEVQNVYFIHDRIDVRWAGFNTVKALFNSIRQICHTGNNYNFINVLSGQDYPLKSANHLSSFFKKNAGKEFIAYRDILNDWTSAQSRYKKFHLTNFSFNGKTLFGQHSLERLINYLFKSRNIPYKYHPYGESMFWMLSPEAALYVANTVENDKKLKCFFYYTWASDEFLFQTIIMNSEYKHKVINNNYRYIDWSEQRASPKILNVNDFEKLKNSSKLFARKFDVLKDEVILNMIDNIF